MYVQELAKHFNVAQETIRRDLSKLETQKLLKKIHGGAVNIQSKFERNFTERAQAAVDEKKRLQRKRLNLLNRVIRCLSILVQQHLNLASE